MLRAIGLLVFFIATSALAQVGPSNYPQATVPLTGLDAVLLDQGSGCATHVNPCVTSQVSSLRIGQPIVQTTPPVSPFPYQTWWDTSTNPQVYKVHNGTMWLSVYQVDVSSNIASLAGNVYIPSGNLGIGTTSVVPNWPITLFENNTLASQQGVTSNAYENSSTTVGSIFRAFSARGSLTAPISVQANDTLGGLHASGFWSGKLNAYYITGDARAAIEMQAAENWSAATNNGTNIILKTTPTASTTMSEVARIDSTGSLGIGTISPLFALTISRNNPVPSGSITQGVTVNTYENSTSLTGAGFRGFAARGTTGSPVGLVTNDQILVLSGSGFWTGKASNAWASVDGRATIGMYAAENWSGAINNGTYMTFSVTATSAAVQTERMRLNASGGVGIGTTSDPGVNNLLVASVIQAGATDVGLSRTGAATLALGNGTASNKTGTLQLTVGALQCTTFANRPGTPVAGMTTCFTDSNTAVWGAAIAGGGGGNVQARYNGANWTVVGI